MCQCLDESVASSTIGEEIGYCKKRQNTPLNDSSMWANADVAQSEVME